MAQMHFSIRTLILTLGLFVSPLASTVAHADDGVVHREKSETKRRKSDSSKKKKKKKAKKRKKKKQGAWARTGVSDKDIGLALEPLDADARERLGRRGGLRVCGLDNGGQAALAGVQVGDVIMSVGGKSVIAPKDAFEPLLAATAGEIVAVTLVRDGADVRVEVEAPLDEVERKANEKQQREEQAEQRQREADERADASYARRVEADDQFSFTNCVCCSLVFPGFTPIWIALWLLVDAQPVRQQRNDSDVPGVPEGDEDRVMPVAY